MTVSDAMPADSVKESSSKPSGSEPSEAESGSKAENRKEEKLERKLEKILRKEELSEKKNENGKDEKVKSEKDRVRSADDPCLSWVKLGTPVRAVLLCVHGLGLNSDSWTKFGQDMSQFGVATYAVDVRGFGSFTLLAHEKCNFPLCVKNVEETLRSLHKANPNKPVFLMGESMGGAIVLHVVAQSPDLVDGVISVCSSGDRFKQKKTDLEVFLHMFLGPGRKFDIGDKIVDQATMSKDKLESNPELKKEWEGDKLDQMKMSPIELMEFQHFMNENHEEVKKITRTPVLMIQGRQDPLVKPEGTEELFNELKTADKQMIMVENAKHLIFEDQQFSADTLALVVDWIFDHCPAVAEFRIAMETTRASLAAGQLPKALQSIQTALELMPRNANAHQLMGLVQMRLQHPVIARRHLVLASRLGHGKQISVDANRVLMTLPQDVVAPRRIMEEGGKVPFSPAVQPSVIIFSANWCQPCQDMSKVMKEAKQRYGDIVKFQMVDVDDPANADLVEHYSIGPVPTTVFLRPNGDLASFQIGYDGIDGMLKGLLNLTRPRNLRSSDLDSGSGPRPSSSRLPVQ